MGGKTSSTSINKYMTKAYDRVNLVIPKGKKEVLEALAATRGLSVNGLINTLLREAAGLTEEEWKRSEE